MKLYQKALTYLTLGAVSIGVGLGILGCTKNETNLESKTKTEQTESEKRILVSDYLDMGGGIEYSKELAKIKDEKGNTIFDDGDISNYFKIGGTIEYAKKLAKITNEKGNTIFDGWDISDYFKAGGTIEYAKELAKITDSEGKTIFDGWNISDYFEMGGTIEYAKELAKITDSKGKTIFDYGWEISNYFKAGGAGAIEYTKELAKIKDEKGNTIFDGRNISNYFKIGGTIEYAKELAKITNEKGNTIFNGRDISNYFKIGGTIEYAKELAKITDSKGKTLFAGFDIFYFFEVKGTVEYAKELAKITDSEGKTMFGDAWEISKYFKAGGADAIDYFKELAKIKNNKGKSVFSKRDILQYFRTGGDIKHAKNLVKELIDIPNIDNFKIYRAAQLGLTKKELLEFDETKKPNAVIVYPTEDWNRAFEQKEAIDLFKKIKEKYDVHVAFAETEEEAYNAIDNTPNIELLILNGHGIKTTLSLGERDLRLYQANRNEKYTIDTSDTELNQHLDNLVQNAVIFLNSCSNAKGGKNGDNLANFIIKMTKNKKVFASTTPFNKIKVNSIYPFDIDIIMEEVNKTYTNKK